MMRILRLAIDDALQRSRSLRMLVLLPLLTLFILGACWGISDPEAKLPSTITAETPMEVLFVASLFILLSSTLGVVLFGFDGISRDRMTGVLAVELSQPIPRRELAASLLLAALLPVLVPTLVLSLIGVIMIRIQMGDWAGPADLFLFLISTTLLLFWYATIQLYASSLARDIGSSITIGLAAWMLFTMVWLLVTVVIAALLGVDATDTSDPAFEALAAKVDLLSPNGVYHLLLEMRIGDDLSRPISSLAVLAATVAWTILPLLLYLRRFERMEV